MKVILFTTLLLFSVNGFASNWKKFLGDDDDSYYIDVDSIKEQNGLIYYLQLTDYRDPSKDGDHSTINKWSVNCEEKKVVWLTLTFYSQPMGKGRITTVANPNKILYPKPNTVAYDVMKDVCNNAR